MSEWHRKVPNVKGFDVDMVQICPWCSFPEFVVEGSSDPNKAFTYISRLGKQLHIPGLLIIHEPDDKLLEGNMQVWRVC